MPLSYFSENTEEITAITRPALERLPITGKTAKILSNTWLMLLDGNSRDKAAYVTMLRESVVAELEIARIFNRAVQTSMRDLVDCANRLAHRKQIPGI